MMLFTITTKLDPGSRELWEQTLKSSLIPPLNDLFEYLEQRARVLAAGGTSKSNHSETRRIQAHHGRSNLSCKICQESVHSTYECLTFNSMTVPESCTVVREYNVCTNCLFEEHFSKQCTSSGRCESCNSKHHTLLHRSNVTEASSSSSSSSAVVLGHHSRKD